MALGIVLLQGPRRGLFLMSGVPLYSQMLVLQKTTDLCKHIKKLSSAMNSSLRVHMRW